MKDKSLGFTGEQMNKYRKLMRDTVILGFGTFASKVLVLLLIPLYTSRLNPGQFNLAELISQTANLLIPLASAGVCDGLFRFTLGSAADKPSVFKNGLTVLAISTALFLALSPLLLLIEYFRGYVWLIISYVLAANLHSALAQYLRACDRMKLFAAQGILNTALVISFNLVFLLGFDMGVIGYVLSVVISDIIVSVFLIVYTKLWLDFGSGRISLSLTRDMLRYSVPMIPTVIFWWVTNVSGRYFVTWFCGEEAAGLFTAAYKIPTLLTLITTVFYEAWQFSAVKDAEEKKQSKFFGSVFSYYSSLMFMAGAGVVLLSRVFVSLLFAKSYSGAWSYIPALSAAAVFSALTTFMGSVYLVKKKSELSFMTSLLGALTNLVLNLTLIPLLGAQGAAVAAVASFFTVFIIRAVSVQKHLVFFVNYLRLSVNTALLFLMCAVTVIAFPYWWIVSSALMALMLAVNARTLLRCAVGAIRQLGFSRPAPDRSS